MIFFNYWFKFLINFWSNIILNYQSIVGSGISNLRNFSSLELIAVQKLQKHQSSGLEQNLHKLSSPDLKPEIADNNSHFG